MNEAFAKAKAEIVGESAKCSCNSCDHTLDECEDTECVCCGSLDYNHD